MEVFYTLTKEDVASFQRFHLRRKGKWRWLTVASNILLVILWVLQLALVVRLTLQWRFVFGLGPHAWWLVAGMHQHLLVSFLLFSLYLVYVFWGQKYLRRRQIPDASLLAQPKHMVIGSEGVKVVTESESIQRSWSSIRDIDSDQERIYLYVTPTTALIVPKRSFENEGSALNFETEARAFRMNPYTNGSRNAGPVDAGVWPPPPQITTCNETLPEPELDDEPGSVEIQYVTRKADLWRSQVYLLSRRPSALLGIFIPYVFAAGIWTLGRLPLLLALFWTLIGAVAAMLLTLAWLTRKALTQRFAQYADGRPCRTLVRSEMLCDITPDGRNVYRWVDITSVRHRSGDIYIFAKGNRSAVIPRTAFADQRSAQDFVATIERYRRAAQDTTTQSSRVPSIP